MEWVSNAYADELKSKLGDRAEVINETGRNGDRLIVCVYRPGKPFVYLAHRHPSLSEISPTTLAHRLLDNMDAYP